MYSCLICSAFFISFFGVFWSFFANPCVATTNDLSSLSQKANSLYALLSYSALNSQISVPCNFLNNFGSLLPSFTLFNTETIFLLASFVNPFKNVRASSNNKTLILFILLSYFAMIQVLIPMGLVLIPYTLSGT